MRPDGVSNPGPLTYESGALPTALQRCSDLGWVQVSPDDHDVMFCYATLTS